MQKTEHFQCQSGHTAAGVLSFAKLESMSFAGLKVLALESRRAAEIAELIRRQGGEPCVAPAVREAPAAHGDEVTQFGERLLAGSFEMVIFLTGVGTRLLSDSIGSERFAGALRRLTTVVRGPKPAAVLREINVSPAVLVPPPHTWREILAATANRPEKRIAVQEYGRSNPELLAGLRVRGADVTAVRPYRWELPQDPGPLEAAARRAAAGEFGVALFTAGVQVEHLFGVAAAAGLEARLTAALERMAVGSIGPATTEALEEFGVRPDLEASSSKMGILVHEMAEQAASIAERKCGRDQ